jgi:hypothetical protein
MKLKDLIKELGLYDKELQVIVQSQPFIQNRLHALMGSQERM